MIRRPPRSTHCISSAASDVYKRQDSLDASTELFGSMPELDSMAVVALSVNLEKEFDFEIDDEDFSGEVFETIGTLAEFVENSKR